MLSQAPNVPIAVSSRIRPKNCNCRRRRRRHVVLVDPIQAGVVGHHVVVIDRERGAGKGKQFGAKVGGVFKEVRRQLCGSRIGSQIHALDQRHHHINHHAHLIVALVRPQRAHVPLNPSPDAGQPRPVARHGGWGQVSHRTVAGATGEHRVQSARIHATSPVKAIGLRPRNRARQQRGRRPRRIVCAHTIAAAATMPAPPPPWITLGRGIAGMAPAAVIAVRVAAAGPRRKRSISRGRPEQRWVKHEAIKEGAAVANVVQDCIKGALAQRAVALVLAPLENAQKVKGVQAAVKAGGFRRRDRHFLQADRARVHRFQPAGRAAALNKVAVVTVIVAVIIVHVPVVA